MIHLLYGAEAFILQEKRQELLEDIEPFSISIHDMRETTVQSAVEDARTLDLFGETKTLILRDCYFLTGEIPRTKIEHDLDSLVTYLKNPNQHTTMIMMVQHDQLDKRKKIVKEVLKVAKTFEAKPLSYVQGWIKERFNIKLTGYLSDIFSKTGQALLQLFIDGEVLSIERVEACRHGRVKASAQDLLTAMDGKLSRINRRLLEDSFEEIFSLWMKIQITANLTTSKIIYATLLRQITFKCIFKIWTRMSI